MARFWEEPPEPKLLRRICMNSGKVLIYILVPIIFILACIILNYFNILFAAALAVWVAGPISVLVLVVLGHIWPRKQEFNNDQISIAIGTSVIVAFILFLIFPVSN